MNARLVVPCLKDLQARLDSAKAHKDKCSKEVAAAKQTFTATPDTLNARTLSDAKLSFLGACGVERKAKEALRIFTFQRKTVSQNGKLIRL